MKDLAGLIGIGMRLNPNHNYGSAQSKAADLQQALDSVKRVKNPSIQDKYNFHKSLTGKVKTVVSELTGLHAKGTQNLQAAEQELTKAVAPQYSDHTLTALLVGKTKEQALDMGFKSAAFARLLLGDAGVAFGINADESLLKVAAPEQYSAVTAQKEYLKGIDQLTEPLASINREVNLLELNADEKAVMEVTAA